MARGGRFESGLYSAAIGSANDVMNNFCWIRDNYYLWLTGNAEMRKGIERGFQKFIDYNIFLGKFDGSLGEEYMFVHPLCTGDIREITVAEPGRKWGFIQSDCYGNLLEVVVSVGDKRRADIMLEYLDKVSFWELKDYGFWECDERMIHASSLASCLRGIEKYENSFGRRVGEMRVSGYDSLKLVLRVGESLVRESDLAMMSLLYPLGLDEGIIDSKMEKEIYLRVLDLEREFGFKRFIGDDWDGLIHHDGCEGRDLIRGGHEMQWTIGLPWKYLVTGRQEDKEKAMSVWRENGSPEGFVPVDRIDLSRGWTSNCTSLLFWALGMQLAMGED